ncbi:der1-like family protein [Cystoisospora suis]|uniref:Der1-like family protein n=1 Tax=Cystoisospora suis TaxID=483139 RepID=A0A2C6LCM7_9APIC|nr:der1-like family protein [Cystoisospora suis]
MTGQPPVCSSSSSSSLSSFSDSSIPGSSTSSSSSFFNSPCRLCLSFPSLSPTSLSTSVSSRSNSPSSCPFSSSSPRKSRSSYLLTAPSPSSSRGYLSTMHTCPSCSIPCSPSSSPVSPISPLPCCRSFKFFSYFIRAFSRRVSSFSFSSSRPRHVHAESLSSPNRRSTSLLLADSTTQADMGEDNAFTPSSRFLSYPLDRLYFFQGSSPSSIVTLLSISFLLCFTYASADSSVSTSFPSRMPVPRPSPSVPHLPRVNNRRTPSRDLYLSQQRPSFPKNLKGPAKKKTCEDPEDERRESFCGVRTPRHTGSTLPAFVSGDIDQPPASQHGESEDKEDKHMSIDTSFFPSYLSVSEEIFPSSSSSSSSSPHRSPQHHHPHQPLHHEACLLEDRGRISHPCTSEETILLPRRDLNLFLSDVSQVKSLVCTLRGGGGGAGEELPKKAKNCNASRRGGGRRRSYGDLCFFFSPSFRRRQRLEAFQDRIHEVTSSLLVSPLRSCREFYFSIPPATRMYCSFAALLTLLSSPTVSSLIPRKIPLSLTRQKGFFSSLFSRFSKRQDQENRTADSLSSFNSPGYFPSQSSNSRTGKDFFSSDIHRPKGGKASQSEEPILSPEQMALHAERIIRAFEFWRPFTAGSFFGGITLGTLLRIYGVYSSLQHMEVSAHVPPGAVSMLVRSVEVKGKKGTHTRLSFERRKDISVRSREKNERYEGGVHTPGRTTGRRPSYVRRFPSSSSPSPPFFRSLTNQLQGRREQLPSRRGEGIGDKTEEDLLILSKAAIESYRSSSVVLFLLIQTGLLSAMASLLKIPFFSSSLATAALYTNCRRAPPGSSANLIMGIKIPQKLLPFGLVAVDVLHAQEGRAAIPGLLGIFSGELYHFISQVLPHYLGREGSFLEPPAFLQRFFMRLHANQLAARAVPSDGKQQRSSFPSRKPPFTK